MREPLLLPACALAAGIVAGREAPFSLLEGPAAALALVLLALLLRRRARPRAAAAVFALAFLPLGGYLATVRQPLPTPSHLQPGRDQLLSGCVVRPLAGPPNRRWFVLETGPGVLLRVTLSGGDRHPASDLVHYGQRLSFTARVREPRNFQNPGSFDYSAYLAARGIHWQATLPARSPAKTLPGHCGSAPAAFIFHLRQSSLARLDQLFPHQPFHRSLLKGLLVGDNSEIQRVWIEDFRRTGTYHALVISGSHISFVAGLFLLWWRFSRWGEFPLLAAAATTAWLYALVASADPPVLRSAAGFTLFVAARFFYRPPRLLNIIAAVALLFLLLDPWQLFEASFQLSFLAVLAIAALAVPVLHHTSSPLYLALNLVSRPRRPLPINVNIAAARAATRLRLLINIARLLFRLSRVNARRLIVFPLRAAAFAWDLFIVSAAVQLALVLPMVFYFHRLSLSGLSANVFATPIITLAIPFGFIAVLFNFAWAGHAAAALLDFAHWIVTLHARWEPAWRVPDPPLWLVLTFAAALLLTAIALRHPRPWSWAPAAIAAASLVLIVLHPFSPRLRPALLELSVLDVGQGESLFLASPEGRTLLLDAGGLPTWGSATPPRLDIGEDVVAPFLWHRGIRRLDVLVLSHLHQDHAGGAPAILHAFRPAELWLPPQKPSPAWDRLRTLAHHAGARIRFLRQGDNFPWAGLHIETLAPHPLPEYLTRQPNDECLVLRLRHGRNSFLLTADAEPLTEAILLDQGLLQPADVLKVAHHGSRRSTRPAFLDAVRPAFALISVGRDNPHNMPGSRVIDDLRARSAMIFRTDHDGLISLFSDGRRITIDRRRAHLRPSPF